MDIRELRLGNIVNFGNRQGFVYVLSYRKTVVIQTYTNFRGNFGNFSMTQGGESHSVKIENIQGVKLTEEWLLKFGFEPLTKKSRGYKADTYSYSGKVSLILNHNGVRTWTNFWQGNEMRYVHQLQNLYFALTGEELTIKDNTVQETKI